jgi:biopolymer transport protein ExbD
MAVSLADNDGDDEFAESHEINVTPFIDVMLVLLIIFMVAAPLSTVDLPLNLPTSTAQPTQKDEKSTYVSLKADLTVALDADTVKRVDLIRLLDAKLDAKKDTPVYLRADRSVPYGEVTDLLQLLKEGSYTKIKLELKNVPPSPGEQVAPASPNP